jgi:steroid 5-alpha reductase family enzyme
MQAALPLDSNFLALTALVTFGYQLSFYIVAGCLRFDKVTDFAYGTNFIVLAIMTLCVRGEYHPRQIVVSALVILWGIRLAGYLLMRIIVIGEDHRFDKIRKDLLKFGGFWLAQFVSIWVIFVPIAILNAIPNQSDLQWRDYLGWAIFGVGWIVEAVGDQQKFAYRNNPTSKGHWCDAGLWNYTRHPNYFGEMLCWWGLFTSGASMYSGAQWAGVVGPLYVVFILLFLSGIPALEESADKKYWNRPDYQEYKKSVSVLIPLPHFVYRNLPRILKGIFLCEFPYYTYPQSPGENVKPNENEKPKEKQEA